MQFKQILENAILITFLSLKMNYLVNNLNLKTLINKVLLI